MTKTLLLSLFFLATANIQIGQEDPDYGKRFGRIIKQASINIQEVARRRPFRLKNWNNSMEQTAIAARAMASDQHFDVAWEALENARQFHPDNNFAILLQAVLMNSSQGEQAANAYFEQFLFKSITYTEFEESFIKWAPFHMLRRIVYELLVSRGVSFEGREEEIQVRIPYAEFFEYVMRPSHKDWIMNVSFVILILGGAVALILMSLQGMEFSGSIAGTLLTIYMLVWIAYGLWIFDLAIGLPGPWSRHSVVTVFLGTTIGGLILFETYLHWKDRNRPLEDGYRRCPYCRAIIVELSIECSECHRKIDN